MEDRLKQLKKMKKEILNDKREVKQSGLKVKLLEEIDKEINKLEEHHA